MITIRAFFHACRFPRQNRRSRHYLVYQTRASSTHQHELVQVKVGGNGQIDINVAYSKQPLSQQAKIVVTLPPGPRSIKELGNNVGSEKQSFRDVLAEFAHPEHTYIQINYRIGGYNKDSTKDHRFPTPIHDVFAAWAYLTNPSNEHGVLARNREAEGGASENECAPDQQAQAGLNGREVILRSSHIGASLALSLALTEPHLITQLQLTSPFTDWVVLDELLLPKALTLSSLTSDLENDENADLHSSLSTSLSSTSDPIHRARTAGSKSRALKKQLHASILSSQSRQYISLRTRLFRTPSSYFDSFASPILFLRAPGRDTPLTKTAAVGVDNEVAYMDVVASRFGEEEGDVGPLEKEDVDIRNATEGTEQRRWDYGPYDDDVHVDGWTEGTVRREDQRRSRGDDMSRVETTSREHQIDQDETPEQSTEHEIRTASSDSDASPDTVESRSRSQGEQSEGPTTIRRKVTRRWPPMGMDPTATFPYTEIVVDAPPALPPSRQSGEESIGSDAQALEDVDLVKFQQALELAELLRKVCFRDRGGHKQDGRERVVLRTREGDVINEKGMVVRAEGTADRQGTGKAGWGDVNRAG